MRKNKLEAALGNDTLWGLPKSISDEFIAAYQLRGFRRLGFWLYYIILFCGYGIGVLFWFLCDNLIRQNAHEIAGQFDGFAYKSNFDIGFTIGLVIWMAIAYIIKELIVRQTAMPRKAALFLGMKEKLFENTPPKYLLKKETTFWTDAADLIDYSTRRYTKIIAFFTIPIALFSIYITYVEIHRFSVITSIGVHTAEFSTEEISLKKWDDAIEVKIGCRYVKRESKKPAKYLVIYQVTWGNRSGITLPTNNQLNGKHWLVNFEAIDDILTSTDATFARLKWTKGNPLHPKCLRHHRNKLGPELAPRFDSLLRVDEEG